MVFSAPTACCSLLLERPTKEVLGEDHQPISPGSLMSGKELQREKASHIPSRSSSSLLSTSSRHCKQKIPLPLFLPLPGLRSPPSGIEALTWDRGELPPPPKLPCLALAKNPGTLEKNTECQWNKILKNIRKVQPPSQEKEPPTPICVDSTPPLYLPTPLPIPTINPSILTGQPMTSMAIPSTSMVTASGSLTCSLLYILMSTWTLLPLPKLSFLGLPQVSGWSRGTLKGYQCPSPHLCRWSPAPPQFLTIPLAPKPTLSPYLGPLMGSRGPLSLVLLFSPAAHLRLQLLFSPTPHLWLQVLFSPDPHLQLRLLFSPDPHLRLQPSSVLQQAAPLTPNLWTPHLLPRLSSSSLPLSPGRANSHFTGLFLVLGTHHPVVAMPQPMPRLIYLQHRPTDRRTLQASLDPGLPSQATLGANDGQRPNDYFLLGNPAASVQDKVLVAPEA
ncbi:nuclear pore-associated protein 1-like isoform X2 [Eschrichtius robustus]